ncbi:E3 SUMO-protein ligase ZBED1-like isoform 2-T2 [Menidia menidia]
MDDVPGTPPPTPSSSSSIDCGEGDESLHPWPYLESMFTFIGQKDNSYPMKCQLCLPKDCEILAFKNLPSNLKKHIKSKHDCHLKKYEDLTSLKRKRKTATPTLSSSSIKQPTLDSWTAPHRWVDKAIVNYVVRGLQPFSIVEQEHFRDFVFDLVPNAKIMSRNTLTSRIEDAAKQMKIKIIESMKTVNYIATTTDCWSVRRRGFIGVTAHWLNHDSLKRVSVALACKILRGSHTFDLLANTLNDIHTEFEIRGKIVRTTTDNGSNFIKAFKVFAEEENDNAGAQVQEEEAEETDQDEEEVEFVDVSSLLDEDDSLEFQLPKHQRCACHILNLIATTDAHKAVSNDSYKK